MAEKVKITVVRVFEPKDVIGQEFIRPSGKPINKCGFFKEGDEFIVEEEGQMPEGFICHHAWYGIYKDVSILRWEGGIKDWTGTGVIYGVCPDGLRPVCFKLERIEE